MTQVAEPTQTTAGALEAEEIEVYAAAHAFAEALAESDVFQAWEQAAWALRQDEAARALAGRLQMMQRELQPLFMLGAVTAEQRLELEELRSNYLTLPTVLAYTQAETDLRALCQAANEAVSKQMGLDFATNCASGCCG
jgi:cell fate (sporulation/competence/biofilm development) regulator YlbF (YheA/YmcA/DUF963 family)